MKSDLSYSLEQAANAIKVASQRLNVEEVSKCLNLIDICYERKSKVIISGVGKSGIVARKMAATFSSVGIMAVYINPLDALHGDIGVLHDLDICIFLSNSGETTEILDMIFHVKKRGIKVISLVGNSNSSIARESDSILDAKVEREVCPLNLAPTTSTTVAMAIGDAIAIEFMRRQEISVDDFAINHPAGSLGKKIAYKVDDLMIPIENISTLVPEDNIQRIISEMTRNGMGSCLIVNNKVEKNLVGIITDGDLRRALEGNASARWEVLTAKNFMTTNPITINSSEKAFDALKLMEKDEGKPISILPVFDKEKNLTGILRMHEIIQSGLKEIK